MSNVKEIRITGTLPFDCHATPDLQPFLAQFVCPTVGINIEWGKETLVPNEHGGQTATYDFVISGEEAVSVIWCAKLEIAIADAGGKIKSIFVKDIEEGRIIRQSP